MNALIKSRAEPDLWIEVVPISETGSDDSLVMVNRTGILGTDVPISAKRKRIDTWHKVLVLLQRILSLFHVITHRVSENDNQQGCSQKQLDHSDKVVLEW